MEEAASLIISNNKLRRTRYTHTTTKAYWFDQYGIKIGIPKQVLIDKILLLIKEGKEA